MKFLVFILTATAAMAACELRSHRGNLLGHPEHTVESYVSTIKAGASMIELDVQLSSDGVPVVIHDTTLDRTTTGTGNVNAFTLAQLKTYDAGSDFGGGYTGRRIPTLAEALAAIRPYRACVMIETKGTGFMPQVALAINSSGFPVSRIAWLCGLFTDTATTVHAYFPNAPVWVISSGTPLSLGQATLETAKNTNGYVGASYWPITMAAGDYTLTQSVGFLIGEYIAGGTGIYAKINAGCNLFLTDDPAASQSEWGTSLWAAFVSQYSLGAGTTTQDADADGRSNLDELVMGTNPTVDDVPAAGLGQNVLYRGSGANRIADITIRTPVPLLEGFWWKCQTSADGSTWTDAASTIVSESVATWPEDKAWRLRLNLSNSAVMARAIPILYSTASRP